MLLALDVGFKNLGWVVFDKGVIMACGVIKTEKSKKKSTRVADDNAWRSAQIASELVDIIKTNNVRGVVGELPSGGALNAKAMAQMAMSTAVVASVCQLMEIPAEWSTPMEGKKAIVGRGSASKEEMMEAARRLFPKADFPECKTTFEHIADAVASYMALRQGTLVKIYG